MISWQFSIILQLFCIVIAVTIFLIGLIKIINYFKYRKRIKLSKMLRMTKDEAIENISQIVVFDYDYCDDGCPFNNMRDFCLMSNDDFAKTSYNDCLRTETCKALFKED